jgi:hypothetical protein
MHLGALLLELLDPRLHVRKLALELLNLLRVRPHRLVEGLRQQIRHRLGFPAVQWRRGLTEAAHGAHDAAGHRAAGHGAPRELLLRLLRLRLAGIHFFVGGTRDLLLVFLGAAAVRALLLVVVVGLGA